MSARNVVRTLGDEFPSLLLEWDFEKNGLLLPKEIAATSKKKVWWKCFKGHSWETTISSRTIQKTGCPFCSGLKAITGENDLATTNPELISEWDYEKMK